MKITINPLKSESYELVAWPVTDEPSRIAVDTDTLSYQIILAPEGPILEIYEVYPNGEQGEYIQSIELPK